MPEFDYDLFTIGAGSGGVRASRVAAAHGAKVAVAEEYRVGGTCVIRGCVPKKMLVYGAHFAEDLEDAKQFGWDIPQSTFDWPRLRDHVLGDVDRLNGMYTSYVILAVPLFILAAELMNIGSMTDRLLRFCDAIVGRFRGGLAHVNIVQSIIFAGMSGSAIADAAGTGKMMQQMMTTDGK